MHVLYGIIASTKVFCIPTKLIQIRERQKSLRQKYELQSASNTEAVIFLSERTLGRIKTLIV